MTEITNPRIAEILTVSSAVRCLTMLNENDLDSLNIEWAIERVKELKEQCERFLEKYSE